MRGSAPAVDVVAAASVRVDSGVELSVRAEDPGEQDIEHVGEDGTVDPGTLSLSLHLEGVEADESLHEGHAAAVESEFGRPGPVLAEVPAVGRKAAVCGKHAGAVGIGDATREVEVALVVGETGQERQEAEEEPVRVGVLRRERTVGEPGIDLGAEEDPVDQSPEAVPPGPRGSDLHDPGRGRRRRPPRRR